MDKISLFHNPSAGDHYLTIAFYVCAALSIIFVVFAHYYMKNQFELMDTLNSRHKRTIRLAQVQNSGDTIE